MATRWRAAHKRKRSRIKREIEAQHDGVYWSHNYSDQGHYPEFEHDPNYDREFDDDYDGDCGICGGEGFVDGAGMDPLRYGDDQVRCYSCGGSGRAKDMTVW